MIFQKIASEIDFGSIFESTFHNVWVQNLSKINSKTRCEQKRLLEGILGIKKVPKGGMRNSKPPTTQQSRAVGRGRGGEIPSPGTGGFVDLGLDGGSTRPEVQGLGGFEERNPNTFGVCETLTS